MNHHCKHTHMIHIKPHFTMAISCWFLIPYYFVTDPVWSLWTCRSGWFFDTDCGPPKECHELSGEFWFKRQHKILETTLLLWIQAYSKPIWNVQANGCGLKKWVWLVQYGKFSPCTSLGQGSTKPEVVAPMAWPAATGLKLNKTARFSATAEHSQ